MLAFYKNNVVQKNAGVLKKKKIIKINNSSQKSKFLLLKKKTKKKLIILKGDIYFRNFFLFLFFNLLLKRGKGSFLQKLYKKSLILYKQENINFLENFVKLIFLLQFNLQLKGYRYRIGRGVVKKQYYLAPISFYRQIHLGFFFFYKNLNKQFNYSFFNKLITELNDVVFFHRGNSLQAVKQLFQLGYEFRMFTLKQKQQKKSKLIGKKYKVDLLKKYYLLLKFTKRNYYFFNRKKIKIKKKKLKPIKWVIIKFILQLINNKQFKFLKEDIVNKNFLIKIYTTTFNLLVDNLIFLQGNGFLTKIKNKTVFLLIKNNILFSIKQYFPEEAINKINYLENVQQAVKNRNVDIYIILLKLILKQHLQLRNKNQNILLEKKTQIIKWLRLIIQPKNKKKTLKIKILILKHTLKLLPKAFFLFNLLKMQNSSLYNELIIQDRVLDEQNQQNIIKEILHDKQLFSFVSQIVLVNENKQTKKLPAKLMQLLVINLLILLIPQILQKIPANISLVSLTHILKIFIILLLKKKSKYWGSLLSKDLNKPQINKKKKLHLKYKIFFKEKKKKFYRFFLLKQIISNKKKLGYNFSMYLFTRFRIKEYFNFVKKDN